MPADYRVIQSNGKTIVIIMDQIGFSYRIHKRGSKNQTWCCPKRKRFKCPAILKIQDGWLISGRNNHNHENEELLHKAVPVNLEDEVVQKYLKN